MPSSSSNLETGISTSADLLEEIELGPFRKWRKYGVFPCRLCLHLVVVAVLLFQVLFVSEMGLHYTRNYQRNWYQLLVTSEPDHEYNSHSRGFKYDDEDFHWYSYLEFNSTACALQIVEVVNQYYGLAYSSVDDLVTAAPHPGNFTTLRGVNDDSNRNQAWHPCARSELCELSLPRARLTTIPNPSLDYTVVHGENGPWTSRDTPSYHVPLVSVDQVKKLFLENQSKADILNFFQRLVDMKLIFWFQSYSPYKWVMMGRSCTLWQYKYVFNHHESGAIHVKVEQGHSLRCPVTTLSTTEQTHVHEINMGRMYVLLAWLAMCCAFHMVANGMRVRKGLLVLRTLRKCYERLEGSAHRRRTESYIVRANSGQWTRPATDVSVQPSRMNSFGTSFSTRPVGGRNPPAGSIPEGVPTTFEDPRTGTESVPTTIQDPRTGTESIPTTFEDPRTGTESLPTTIQDPPTSNLNPGPTTTNNEPELLNDPATFLHPINPPLNAPIGRLNSFVSLTSEESFNWEEIPLHDKVKIINGWVLISIVADVLIILFCLLELQAMTLTDESLFEESTTTLAQVSDAMLGCGCSLIFVSFLEYVEYSLVNYLFLQVNRAASKDIAQLLIAVFPVFMGYSMFGTIVYGTHTHRFAGVQETMITLFGVSLGDEMHDTYNDLLACRPIPGWVSVLYLTSFVFIFMYVVSLAFVSVVEYAFITHGMWLLDHSDDGSSTTSRPSAPNSTFATDPAPAQARDSPTTTTTTPRGGDWRFSSMRSNITDCSSSEAASFNDGERPPSTGTPKTRSKRGMFARQKSGVSLSVSTKTAQILRNTTWTSEKKPRKPGPRHTSEAATSESAQCQVDEVETEMNDGATIGLEALVHEPTVAVIGEASVNRQVTKTEDDGMEESVNEGGALVDEGGALVDEGGALVNKGGALVNKGGASEQ